MLRKSRSTSLIVVAFLASVSLCGCATSVALPSFMPPAVVQDVTATIPEPISPLSPALNAEDWRRAKGAMAVALDPQGDGGVVAWSNPASGARGSFAPTGDPYAQADKVCRGFVAELEGSIAASPVRGKACRDTAGVWRVETVESPKLEPLRTAMVLGGATTVASAQQN